MSGPTMLAHLILERLSWNVLPRVPEPEQIMLDPLQNAAFMEAGREDGILAFIYFYQALQITPIIRDGDRVLDLGCGPANQLAQIARLNPRSHFVGLDASAHMLEQARTTLTGVGNVELVSGDMTRLAGIEDASMDCVICTMSLHHLPDLAALSSTMREAMRVLKRGGGLYFVDFGRFKRAGTQRFFSQDRRDCQPEPFTQDYLHSLKAAFSLEELSNAAILLGPEVKCYSTPLAPFMVVFKSPARR
jgi:arsenite methyltransferase